MYMNSIKGQWPKGRAVLSIASVILFLIVIWPLVRLTNEGLTGLREGASSLGIDGMIQIRGTVQLVILTAISGGILGTANGWILANCRFSGRKLLRIAQLLPLATPSYLLAATLIDLGSINGIRIYGMAWGVLVMALTTYPYVFLLSTESFSICGRSQLEAARSLGVGPWNSFRRVALPIALPAIGAGIALMSMEIVNELGAVQLLNIPSISAGIVENWMSKGNPAGAIGLALIALLIVISLVAYEKVLRRRSRRWTEGIPTGEAQAWKLDGIRQLLAQIITITPPIITLGTPIIWSFINIDQLKRELDLDLLYLTIRSLGLGLLTASITVLAALILTISKRWNTKIWMVNISFISGIGYAIPGVVLALALISFGGSPWNFTPLMLLLWGYVIRFLAVAKGGLDAGLERLSPSLDEAATSLGSSWPDVLKRIHLPLLKGPIIVGTLLVFVDTLKELPLTFVLRPFDFDTLSVRIYQYASDERMVDALIPSIIIIMLGIIASLALIPSLDSGQAKSNN